MHPEKNQRNAILLKLVSEKTKIMEGEEAVRKILREIFRRGKVSTKELASLTRLPLPITAAVRRELENEGLLSRERGAFLTDKGKKFIKEQLGFVYPFRLACSNCQGRGVQIPNEFMPLLEKLTKHLDTRPKPLTKLDQAYGTPETALLRALFMLEKGDVEGRRIIFLGDDDFTSIAVGLLRAAGEITVVDVDPRLLAAIQFVSRQENLHITCVEHDLKKPLPCSLHRKYDVVFTDPPYTITGLTLFISRGITALKSRKSVSVYFSFAHQPPNKMWMMQKTLNAMGLAIAEQIPRFNVYEGAEMFANTSFLTRLETSANAKPLVTGVFDGKIYTGEITQTVRTYQCVCGEQVKVASTELIQTVEELKEKGCPKCGRMKGFRLVKKEKLKETLAERLTFRNFEWRDFPAVLGFEREIAEKSFPESPILDENYHRQKLEKALKREPNGLVVALLDEQIVGWLWLRTEKDRSTNAKFGYIKSIIVASKHRHQGFGKKLAEAAKQYFLSRGVHRVDLIVSATNYEATSFFDRVGFEREHSTLRKRLMNGSELIEAD